MSASSITLVGLVLVAVIGLIVGLLAGYLVAGLRNDEQKDQRTGQDSGVEAVRILREKKTGRLSVEINGQLYRASGDMTVNRHNGLARLLAELRIWMGIVEGAASHPGETGAPGVVGQADEMIAGKPGTPPSVVPADEEPPEPSRPNPVAWVSRMLVGKGAEEVPEKSIVAQIDEILQEKLLESPLADRAIRLMELPDKGMVVLIGLEKYASVDEVPDEDVRQLLKACVAEWEDRGGK
ncbi:MAG: hypothetical protein AB1894_15050 [Chloroflexota bacterium]